jgi:hypothetical protein
MKRLAIILMCSLLPGFIIAQTDTTEIEISDKNIITIREDSKKTYVTAGEGDSIEIYTDQHGDTTYIRIGRRTFEVIEGEKGTSINIEKEEIKDNRTSSFNPHWAGFEIGVNMYSQADYSLYQRINTVVPENFMDLNYGKSITVNINIAEWAFKNEAENFGLVTGLGFSFSDYTFDQPFTIEKQNGIIMPIELNQEELKKSKLNINYITAPLLLEFKTPLRMGGSNLYLAAGAIGGLNIGSHTKYKYSSDKEKTRSNFNLNQFKYDLTGRIGFGDFCVFVNYGMTSLFKTDKGPELYPVMFGISFPNI